MQALRGVPEWMYIVGHEHSIVKDPDVTGPWEWRNIPQGELPWILVQRATVCTENVHHAFLTFAL